MDRNHSLMLAFDEIFLQAAAVACINYQMQGLRWLAINPNVNQYIHSSV